MRTPPRVLIADDNIANVRILSTRLTADGYDVVTARDGEEALAVARAAEPDLILLDVMMPKVDGIEVCRRLKKLQDPSFTPIILVTAMTDAKDVIAGLEAGADEYLTKPVDHAALSARVRSMLRIKSLHDTVAAQALEIARWNATLEARVAEQVAELERVSRLKRFFSPQLADAIVAGGAATGVRSVSCSSICAASPPLRRRPSPRRCRTSSVPTTPRWDASSWSTRVRSSASRATA